MPSTSAIDIPLSLEMAKLWAKRANVAFKIILPTMGFGLRLQIVS